MTMSKIEGYPSISALDRKSAAKYHMFILVNIFLGSIITGSALQQLKTFIDLPPTEYVLLLFPRKMDGFKYFYLMIFTCNLSTEINLWWTTMVVT